MAYVTVTDINNTLGPYSVTSRTPVSTSQVTAMIETLESKVNYTLGSSGVTVPVTSSDQNLLDVVKTLVTYGVTAQVLHLRFPDGAIANFWWMMYQECLDDLKTMVGSAMDPSSYWTNNSDEDEPLFTVDARGLNPW